MSRPKPKILLEAVHKDTYKADQILAAEAIYSVFYQGNPINLRTLNKLVSYPGPKYKKVSFSKKTSLKKLNYVFSGMDTN